VFFYILSLCAIPSPQVFLSLSFYAIPSSLGLDLKGRRDVNHHFIHLSRHRFIRSFDHPSVLSWFVYSDRRWLILLGRPITCSILSSIYLWNNLIVHGLTFIHNVNSCFYFFGFKCGCHSPGYHRGCCTRQRMGPNFLATLMGVMHPI